jgi:hypothetical protein
MGVNSKADNLESTELPSCEIRRGCMIVILRNATAIYAWFAKAAPGIMKKMVLNIKADANARRLCEYVLGLTLTNRMYRFHARRSSASRRLIDMRGEYCE